MIGIGLAMACAIKVMYSMMVADNMVAEYIR